MALVAFGSVKASPGATTAALLVAARWPEPCVLVEADESGGVLAAELGLGETPGALELAGRARALDDALVVQHCQRAVGDMPVLVAPGEPHRVGATFRELAEPLAHLLARSETAAVVDCGRLAPAAANWPLVHAARVVVVVARCRLAEFLPVASRVPELRAAGARVGLVTVADGPYPPAEFAAMAGVELLGVLPHDTATAALAQGANVPARALSRSPLWAAAADLARTLAAFAAPARPVGAIANGGAR